MTEFSENHLFGKSMQISKKEGIKGHFDLFIFTCGWESRCKEVTNYNSDDFSFDSALIISFMLGEIKGYLLEYMDELKTFAKIKLKNDRIVLIEDDSKKLGKITDEIDKIIDNLVIKLGRPLNIGFDITSCPRHFFLHLLGHCLKYDITEKISFFYSEGTYKTGISDYVQTKGEWKLKKISEFNSKNNPAHKWLYIVSAGFEGNRYRSLIAKYEPDLIGILIPDPGFHIDYEKKVWDECQPLIYDFNIPDSSIVRAPAGDAISAWEALITPSLNKKDYNITYLTLGPKPHALAMGLHAFLNDNIFVTCRIPEEGYMRIEVEPTEIFWRYDIENLIFL